MTAEVPDAAQLRAGAVTVAYVYSKSVDYSFHKSLIEMLHHDTTNEARIWRGGYVVMKCATNGLVEARNNAVKIFLDEKDADWLFWVDTDMGFAADTIDRLLAQADPVERPIVGGLAFTYKEEVSDGLGGWRCVPTPTIFDWATVEDQQGFTVRFDYEHDALVPCAATGSACVLIHRSVFERVAERYGPIWYDRIENPTTTERLIGEDLSFCLRAIGMGIPVHVDTSVKTTHQKVTWVGEDDYFAAVALSNMRPKVPPAREPVAVVVPVMRRPQNAGPFMASLRASDPTSLARVYAMCDLGDKETIEAWRAAGAQVVDGRSGRHARPNPGRPGTFAEKVNAGYEFSAELDAEPWLLLVGDDVRFQPGWLDHAQHAARDGASVIGTNDLHNPRVTAGEHATHLLIRRSYVDEVGASWDGPKVVCHEGYGHWFVDDEIVAAAKQRGVWAFAKHARIEHLHPLWGNAPDDEVYALGASRAEADKALFEARVAEHAAVKAGAFL